jgi:hypothetical protein
MEDQNNLKIFQVIHLIIVVSVSCQAPINKMQFTKNVWRANMLPTNTGTYLLEAEEVSFPDCAQQCLYTKEVCSGFFHNDHLKLCKTLKGSKDGLLNYINQAGWESWHKGKPYNNVNINIINFNIQ